MTLEHHMENPLGAQIYVDPLGRYTVRVDDHDIDFQRKNCVNLQEDRYIVPYAAMYTIVNDPNNMKKWGIKELIYQ